MELHLHLSVAFRSLDRKWGKPVDLDTSAESVPCVPAKLEQPTTTFSSEEYLRTIKGRPKPYTREEARKRKSIRLKDSFSNISRVYMESTSDLGSEYTLDYIDRNSVYSGDIVNTDDEERELVEQKKPLLTMENCGHCSQTSLDQIPKPKKQKLNDLFMQFKGSVLGYTEKKRKKKCQNLEKLSKNEDDEYFTSCTNIVTSNLPVQRYRFEITDFEL